MYLWDNTYFTSQIMDSDIRNIDPVNHHLTRKLLHPEQYRDQRTLAGPSSSDYTDLDMYKVMVT